MNTFCWGYNSMWQITGLFGTWFQKLSQQCISFVRRRNLNLVEAIFRYASWIFLDTITWADMISYLPSSVLSSPAHGLFKSMFFTIGVLLSLLSASSSKSSGISSAPLRSSGRISLLFRVKKVVLMLCKEKKIIFPSFYQYKTIWIDMYYWWCKYCYTRYWSSGGVMRLMIIDVMPVSQKSRAAKYM